MAGTPTNRRKFSARLRIPPERTRGNVHIDTARLTLVARGAWRPPTPTVKDRRALACQAPCDCSGVEPACGAAIARSSSSQTRRTEKPTLHRRCPNRSFASRVSVQCSAAALRDRAVAEFDSGPVGRNSDRKRSQLRAARLTSRQTTLPACACLVGYVFDEKRDSHQCSPLVEIVAS